MRLIAVTAILAAGLSGGPSTVADEGGAGSLTSRWTWSQLPQLPEGPGVAGPFVGVHNGGLIVAGGANFPEPVWESDKVWHDQVWVLPSEEAEAWVLAGALPRAVAYGAAVSTPNGLLCFGGNDARETFSDVLLIQWHPESEAVSVVVCPPLPAPRAGAGAAVIDGTVYVIAGQSESGLNSASSTLWSASLDQLLSAQGNTSLGGSRTPIWTEESPLPGLPRSLHLTAAQHNGYETCLYCLSGRCEEDGQTKFLTDTWEYSPTSDSWKQRADVPHCVMAGSAIPLGASHILILGGDDGRNFTRTDELRDAHPGFPRESWLMHTITDSWTSAGPTPDSRVTTSAVRWGERIVIPSGEVRPRVRTPTTASVVIQPAAGAFGTLNTVVLIVYLLLMAVIGLRFTSRNRTESDFFRAGGRIPWWAAGCSIFATMLSSLTFTGIPAKAYAQDWVYSIGNFLIPVIAVVAVRVAVPFYRRIDATSAYEYLELRFSPGVRLFGSASFTLFHLFRMAIVMSLTALALAVATPLTPEQSVLLMGVVSIVYCTFGGVEAVIWTDTAQTIVLLGGAVVAIVMLLTGTSAGAETPMAAAAANDKLRLANLIADPSSARLALWVVIAGGIGQNLSSYTADQAVVQRYMTTRTASQAKRAVWTNAALTIPATLLFFGMGTGLYLFYRSHPDRLDPTIATDQIFPYFIATEMPAGLAGLIVAAVFAAAQSTVSTSMNSTAATVVTDFLKPLRARSADTDSPSAGRAATIVLGVIGTLLALSFLDGSVKSRFDAFLSVIGLFMGVLGGLFLLGALTARTNAVSAWIGAVAGVVTMLSLWLYSPIQGYLYTAAGISVCFTTGWLSSLLLPFARRNPPSAELTLFESQGSGPAPVAGRDSAEQAE